MARRPGPAHRYGAVRVVRLEPKILRVLICLAEHAGEVVPKERLIETVWAGTFVTDDVLARAISELRRVFGDHAKERRVIETVPKGGYRLLAQVFWEEVTVASAGWPQALPSRLPTARLGPVAVQAKAQTSHPSEEMATRLEFPIAVGRRASFLNRENRNWRRLRVPLGAVALAIILVLAGASFLRLRRYSETNPQPWITEYRRLTRHEVRFPPFPSEVPMVSDGPRVYFNQYINGVIHVGQVAASGGEPETLRFGLAEHEFVDAISPDGSQLLVGAWNTDGSVLGNVPYWIVPLVGGVPKRLGSVNAHGSCWLPDGRILYAHDYDLFLINADGSGSTKLASVGGKAYWPRVSPDGSLIRFARFSSNTAFRVEALWEVRIDGTGLRPLLPGWNEPPAECCGQWSPDGAYYIFQSTRDGQTHLWAIPERGASPGAASAPVQLTRGPVQFRRPVFSRDGRTLFANGWEARGELTAFNPRSRGMTPYFDGLSAEWLTHSRDGRWVTYVTYPEGELWRARADGSGRMRLTASGILACCARISPDVTQVVFVGQRGDAPGRTYIISMDGTGLREIGTGGDADWSPDGKQLVITADDGLDLVAVDRGTRSRIQNSEGLFSPAWSPDGRRLAATSDGGRLHVYDFVTGEWRQLRSLSVAFPNWSRDSSHLYFFTGRPAPYVIDDISRWNLNSDRVEPVIGTAPLRLAWGITSHWLGLTPDDSPLFLRELSTHDLYALTWQVRDR